MFLNFFNYKNIFDIENISNKHILVLGDVFLDVYYDCDVSRTSAEAPVLIAKTNANKKWYRMGGAGNVASNLADLGARVTFVTSFANDDSGNILCKICEDKNIELVHIKTKKPTIKKIRYYSHNQQILRVDKEIENNCNAISISNISEFLNTIDVAIISDYCKGSFNTQNSKDIIDRLNINNIPIFVDSKDLTFKFSGSTCFTPNHKEFLKIFPKEYSIPQITKLHSLDMLTITKGKHGIHFYSSINNDSYESPAIAKSVFDVSGAGDTVIAVLALLYNKCDFRKAVDIANIAAGIVVQKFGTNTVTKEELNTEVNNYLKQNKKFNYERN